MSSNEFVNIEHKRAQLIREMLDDLDPNPARAGLHETPERAARAWGDWVRGYDQDPFDVLKQFEDGAADGMVFQGMIPFYSHCEHHLAPFFGYAHIGYLPSGKIVGLSKLSRVVDIFARRLQVQERLGAQIVDTLEKGLKPLGVGVVLQARHLCMESRGVQRTGVYTITSALRGAFKNAPEVREEFMGFVRTATQGIHSL